MARKIVSEETKTGDKASAEKSRKKYRIHWAFPLGIGLAGVASVAAVFFRGCWHSNMSWPIRAEGEHGGFSYQVCNDCGIMRLFDERTFRGYGPYGYDVHDLIAHERLLRMQRMQKAGFQDSSISLSQSAEQEANRPQAGSRSEPERE